MASLASVLQQQRGHLSIQEHGAPCFLCEDKVWRSIHAHHPHVLEPLLCWYHRRFTFQELVPKMRHHKHKPIKGTELSLGSHRQIEASKGRQQESVSQKFEEVRVVCVMHLRHFRGVEILVITLKSCHMLFLCRVLSRKRYQFAYHFDLFL